MTQTDLSDLMSAIMQADIEKEGVTEPPLLAEKRVLSVFDL
jgi:hypothetical protein